MKRIISVFAICVMLCSLFVGCGNKQTPTTAPTQSQTQGNTQAPTQTPTQGQTQTPASAVEALESVWNLFAEEEKFWVVGGDYNNAVDNAPGTVDLSVSDYLTTSLLVPEAQLAAISEAASMMHAMNGNNFTCGVYKVADVSAFASIMKDTILANQWICGMPEMLKIVDLGGGYVLVAFGIGDAMNPFFTNLATAYPQAATLVDEPVV